MNACIFQFLNKEIKNQLYTPQYTKLLNEIKQ